MRPSIRSGARRVAWALSVAMLAAALSAPGSASAETADQAAKKPVRAPKPYRLPDGHLNWSGFWAPVQGLLQQNVGLGGSLPGAEVSIGAPPFTQYSAIKSPYKERVDTYRAELAAGKITDRLAQCLPPGMPDMMIMIYGMELLETSGQLTITSEWQAASRRVWLRKEHTPLDELEKTYTGESIGHWEGDSLMVDTIGIRPDVLVNGLNGLGLPHSDKLHIVETFTETRPGILEDKFVFDDPDVFAAPWMQVLTYRYRPDLRLREYVCLENNRNVGDKGEAVFDR